MTAPTTRKKSAKSTARLTKNAISKAISVHRWKLNEYLARPGAPTPDDARTYDVAAVASFIAESRGGGGSLDTLREARLEEVKLKCKRLRVEIEKDEGLWVRRSDVDDLHGRAALGLRALIYDCMENRMPAACAGYDALQLRRYGRDLADQIVGKLAQDVSTWAPTPN